MNERVRMRREKRQLEKGEGGIKKNVERKLENLEKKKGNSEICTT